MGNGFEIMVAALDAAGSKRSRAGGGQVFQCPAHDDASPSLSVSQGTKGMDVVFNCHAHCERDDILAALGLSWRDILGEGDKEEYRQRRVDLWMPCQKNHGCGGQKAAEYRYTDERGVLLYAVARCSRKGDGCKQPFAQWWPNEEMKYGKKWGLPAEIRRVIYRLSEVIQAAREGRRIWILEGEKDVDRMKADFPEETFTTGLSGAGNNKWRLEYCRYFKGASEVIIVADCDNTGLAFAQEVHGHMSSVVEKTRVVCSPVLKDGADSSDHRDFGFGLDDFEVVPFEPVKRRPRMVIQVEEKHREKPVVFNGYGQDRVERSLVGSMMKYGHSYQINEVDLIADERLRVIARAAAGIAAREGTITPECIAFEVEMAGVSTYEKVLPYALELESASFDDTAKPLVAARILRERTLRRSLAHVSRATETALQDEGRELDQILAEVARTAQRAAEEYESLKALYCEPVGDVFTGDVLEEVLLEEQETAAVTNVRALRPERTERQAASARRG
jgi:hypothetical protein